MDLVPSSLGDAVVHHNRAGVVVAGVVRQHSSWTHRLDSWRKRHHRPSHTCRRGEERHRRRPLLEWRQQPRPRPLLVVDFHDDLVFHLVDDRLPVTRHFQSKWWDHCCFHDEIHPVTMPWQALDWERPWVGEVAVVGRCCSWWKLKVVAVLGCEEISVTAKSKGNEGTIRWI